MGQGDGKEDGSVGRDLRSGQEDHLGLIATHLDVVGNEVGPQTHGGVSKALEVDLGVVGLNKLRSAFPGKEAADAQLSSCKSDVPAGKEGDSRLIQFRRCNSQTSQTVQLTHDLDGSEPGLSVVVKLEKEALDERSNGLRARLPRLLQLSDDRRTLWRRVSVVRLVHRTVSQYRLTSSVDSRVGRRDVP